MQDVKLLFFLAVWKRPEITEICFMGLNRLKKLGRFHVEHFAVISEKSMIPLCEKYGIDWCMHENLPLGAKKNYGLTQAMKKDFDYLIEIGSDDILKNEFLDLYKYDCDVLALADFIMMNTVDGECRRLTKRHAYYGVGRAISKRALSSLLSHGMYQLWNDRINHGLDNQSTFFLAKRGFLEKRISSPEPVAIDLKSSVNIWPFQKIGIEYPTEKALEGLSEEEVRAIKSLACVES
jgi:hypothetical protein